MLNSDATYYLATNPHGKHLDPASAIALLTVQEKKISNGIRFPLRGGQNLRINTCNTTHQRRFRLWDKFQSKTVSPVKSDSSFVLAEARKTCHFYPILWCTSVIYTSSFWSEIHQKKVHMARHLGGQAEGKLKLENATKFGKTPQNSGFLQPFPTSLRQFSFSFSFLSFSSNLP